MGHTWTVKDRGYEFAILDENGDDMATVPFDQSPIDQPLDSAEGRRATLLAAAPALLAALQDLLHVHGCSHDCAVCDEARAAIARAKGGQ